MGIGEGDVKPMSFGGDIGPTFISAIEHAARHNEDHDRNIDEGELTAGKVGCSSGQLEGDTGMGQRRCLATADAQPRMIRVVPESAAISASMPWRLLGLTPPSSVAPITGR